MKKFLLLLLPVVIIGSSGAVLWSYKDLHRPIAHDKSSQYIEIARGSTPTGVVRRLASEGIIKHPWPLMVYMKLTGAGARIKAGE